ncbi:Indoleamine 2,3-dioxygenase [Lipomyces japonicus]|uniref:Indoleamine 2,3-dioxygenase n=1 Tax=Lipomyces japonicus TaxID=56871 RepID=UPI0034CD2328
MLPSIPNPVDFDVSLTTGFVPDRLPLTKLSDSYFASWEFTASILPFLIMTGKVRAVIDSSSSFPELNANRLANDRDQQRRAYSILGFIAHAYIWCGDANDNKNNKNGATASDHLPVQIANPLLQLSEWLEVPPLATYAGLCLWNHQPLLINNDDDDGHEVDPSKLDLSSLATLHTFTGSIDESWFYLVSTVIEIKGAQCITHMLDAMHACRRDLPHDVIVSLQSLAEKVDDLIPILTRLPEQCDPHTFYYRIRPFLAGSKNMADAGLPFGVRYGDQSNYRQYAGGSNAQSSLIQALDIGLGVRHRPTGVNNNNNDDDDDDYAKSNNFIHEMRQYMPGPHRRFLEHLELAANIRDYVLDHQRSNPALTLAYDACLAMLRSFRDKHIQIVSRYIIIPAKSRSATSTITTNLSATTTTTTTTSSSSKLQQQQQQQQQPRQQLSSTKKQGLANVSVNEKKLARGTGGTALIPFLKQARDETGEPAAGSWAARLLRDDAFYSQRSSQAGMNNANTTAGTVDDKEQSVGLAGKWSVSDDYGGICHW